MNLSRLSVRRAGPSFGRAFGGIGAIGTKELRGRMRGRRAFIAITLYLGLLAGFAWMLESLQANAFQNMGFGTATLQSSQIGTTVFAGLLLLQTLIVLVLAPAFTAGAISLEREKQTLDLLVATPISSLSIVLGKLFSALAWAFLLIIASIPLTAMVFVFGGVGPEDLVRMYVVLLVEAFGLGCVGLFFSALLKRTLAATIVTYCLVLAMTVGATFVYAFLSASSGVTQVVQADGTRIGRPNLAPEALLWFNPFVADMDVMCPTGTGIGGTCPIIAAIMGQDQSFNGGVRFAGGGVVGPAGPVKVLPDGSLVMPDGTIVGANGAPVPLPVPIDQTQPGPIVAIAPAGPVRDSYWPRSAAAWLVLSILLVVLSVNLVSPTRRWRPRIWRRRRGTGTAVGAATSPEGTTASPAGGGLSPDGANVSPLSVSPASVSPASVSSAAVDPGVNPDAAVADIPAAPEAGA